nr:4701_t:CDS:2 [Entrophospora candida]CAG8572047.1 5460_t:CDS:2 [Entrophospora candida]
MGLPMFVSPPLSKRQIPPKQSPQSPSYSSTFDEMAFGNDDFQNSRASLFGCSTTFSTSSSTSPRRARLLSLARAQISAAQMTAAQISAQQQRSSEQSRHGNGSISSSDDNNNNTPSINDDLQDILSIEDFLDFIPSDNISTTNESSQGINLLRQLAQHDNRLLRSSRHHHRSSHHHSSSNSGRSSSRSSYPSRDDYLTLRGIDLVGSTHHYQPLPPLPPLPRRLNTIHNYRSFIDDFYSVIPDFVPSLFDSSDDGLDSSSNGGSANNHHGGNSGGSFYRILSPIAGRYDSTRLTTSRLPPTTITNASSNNSTSSNNSSNNNSSSTTTDQTTYDYGELC